LKAAAASANDRLNRLVLEGKAPRSLRRAAGRALADIATAVEQAKAWRKQRKDEAPARTRPSEEPDARDESNPERSSN
ncbi:MAG: hypothetical protein R3336_01165, partial [Phycisphaeraceae bacterium]|nr:hypothetical protein [Phycisphaeraceae bacterium]